VTGFLPSVAVKKKLGGKESRKEKELSLLSHQVDRVHHLESAADPLGAALGPRARAGTAVPAVLAGVGGAAAAAVCRRRGAPPRRRRRRAAAAVPRAAAAPGRRLLPGRRRAQVRDHLDGDGRAVPDAAVDAAVGPLADQEAELDVGERVRRGRARVRVRVGGVCGLFSRSVSVLRCGPPGGVGFLSGLLGRDLFFVFVRLF